MASDFSALSSGLSELMVLRLLQAQEMYGYEIVQAIAMRTRQVLLPGEGVIYPLLHTLEKDGALTSRRKITKGRSRIYYGLTAQGKKRLAALTDHWSALNGAVGMVLHAV